MRSGDDYNRGLYRKFKVERTDGRSAPGKKHANCRYFVLDVDHDEFAAGPLREYAIECRERFPKLANDIDRLLRGENVFGGSAAATAEPSDTEILDWWDAAPKLGHSTPSFRYSPRMDCYRWFSGGEYFSRLRDAIRAAMKGTK